MCKSKVRQYFAAMTLQEFLDNFHIHPQELAFRCGISLASVYNYLGGYNIPSQRIAERIELETNSRVTVKELRGKDDRENKKRRKR